jgi:hypothetical protein
MLAKAKGATGVELSAANFARGRGVIGLPLFNAQLKKRRIEGNQLDVMCASPRLRDARTKNSVPDFAGTGG